MPSQLAPTLKQSLLNAEPTSYTVDQHKTLKMTMSPPVAINVLTAKLY